jgi:protease I
MEKPLLNKNILVMVANGVDEGSLSTVQRELLKAGATVKIAGMESGLVNSWNGATWGMFFPVDQQVGVTLGSDFDALVVPAGIRGVQKLSTSAHAERILSSFLTADKPVALMGDAVAILEKTGHIGADKRGNVMAGEAADIARLIAHFAMPQDEKIAA